MKTTLIKIKNILGITELQLNGASVEITGTNGTGKVIRHRGDPIRADQFNQARCADQARGD